MAAGKDKMGRPLVVVTGLGVVTSLGAGKSDNWTKLTSGESGIKAITRFPTDGLKTRIAGTIDYLPPQANAVLHLLPHISELYAIHLTPGHIPGFPRLFSRDKTLNLEEVNANIRDALARFNETVREAVGILKTIPETRVFLHNFLNPEWKRQPGGS